MKKLIAIILSGPIILGAILGAIWGVISIPILLSTPGIVGVLLGLPLFLWRMITCRIVLSELGTMLVEKEICGSPFFSSGLIAPILIGAFIGAFIGLGISILGGTAITFNKNRGGRR